MEEVNNMKENTSYEQIEKLCEEKGYDRALGDILELIKQHQISNRKTMERAKETFCGWWYNATLPNFKTHRIEYILTYHFRKEVMSA